ncbi:unnamed protein product [Closterium sp. NIES-54]
MLGMAANHGWRIKQMDITTAFLNGIILEELYMLQPEGLDDGSGRVCRLKKAIYGLKQAPRAWYHKLEETLLAGGFKKSECDHSLFLLQEKEQFLMLLVYVDDILLFSESAAMIEHVEEMLEMTSLIFIDSFPDDVELSRWSDLLKKNVAIFYLDFDAILAAMYAVTDSAEGTSESAAPGAGESALSGTAPTEALHNFTIESGALRSFFRDSTTLTPLSRPVVVSLADPSGGPVLAHSFTVLPCLAAPLGLLSGHHLPSFSTNLVSGVDLQDLWVDQFTPGGQRVTHYTCSRTGRHLATFTRRPGSSLHTLTTASGLVAASGQVFAAASRSSPASAPCSCCPLSHETLLWYHHLGHPSLPCLRGMASRTLGHERYFLLVVDDYSRYTTIFPLPRKGEVTETFTLPASPQQNRIAERRIGMVMDVSCTSMIHAAAPHFLWPFAVQYAAHQINLQPRVSLPGTTPTMRWMGKVCDASVFRVWGSRAFVRDTSADKLSSCAVPCIFLGFPPDAPGWQFYHPTSRCVLSSQDVTFDESGPTPSGVLSLRVGGPGGAEPRVAESKGAKPGGAELERVEPGGPETGGAETGGAVPGDAEPDRAESEGPPAAGGAAGAGSTGAAGPEGASAGRTGSIGGPIGVGATEGAGAAGPKGARTRGAGAAGAGGAVGVGAVGAGAVATGGAAGAGAAGGTGAGGAAGVVAGDPGAEDTGAVSAVFGVAAQPLLQQVRGLLPSTGPTPPLLSPPPVLSQSRLQPASPLPGPSPYSGPTRSLTERREPKSCPASPESRLASPESLLESPVCGVRTGHRVPRQRPPLPGTHSMTLRPSTAPQRVPLLSPPTSSLPFCLDSKSDSLRAASPTVTRFLATAVTNPSFESTTASALFAELVDFAAACRLDYAASLVAESESASVCPPSVGGECALGMDVLEDR